MTIEVVQGQNGPWLSFQGHRMNDPDAPLAEARRHVAGLNGLHGRRIFLFGLELGYHARALAERWPDAGVTAFEPVPEIAAAYDRHQATTGSDPARVDLVPDWERFTFEVSQGILYGASARPAVLVTPGYEHLFPEKAAYLKGLVSSAMLRRDTNDKTIVEKRGIFLDHMVRNLPEILAQPEATGLKGRFPGIPGFIIGSGPGLEKNGAFLRQAKNNGLLIAAGSAVKPLSALGVLPDIAVVAEAEDTSGYLAGIDGAACLLAAGSASHPNHFNVPGYAKAAIHLTSGAAYIYGSDDFVPQGGTAGSAAFSLGLILGLNPLILLGQDMAFSGARVHAAGTPGDLPASEEGALFSIRGINQETVSTHAAFFSSLHWFAEAARFIRDTRPGVRLFNCSESGAEIPGMPSRPFREVLAECGPGGLSAAEKPVSLVQGLPRPDPAEIRERLTTAYGIANSIAAINSRSPESIPALLEDVRSVHPFLSEALFCPNGDYSPLSVQERLRETESFLVRMIEVLTTHGC